MIQWFRTRNQSIRIVTQVLRAAERESQRDGRQEPAAEDLVLAALELPDGTAQRALATVGCDAEGLRNALAAQHANALSTTGISGDVPDNAVPPLAAPRGVYRSAGSAQELFQEVTRRQRQAGSPLTSAWFLLVGAERVKGPLARALAELDLSRTDVVRAAKAEIR